MRFNKVPVGWADEIIFGAGCAASTFDVATGTLDAADVLFATKGGFVINVKREWEDFGEDVDNVPPGTMQLLRPKPFEVTLSTTVLNYSPETLKILLGTAAVSVVTGSTTNKKITPVNELNMTDFEEYWILEDYSTTSGDTGMAVFHIKNAISLEGFQATFVKDAKGEYPLTLKGVYDMDALEDVPIEMYIDSGSST